MRAPPISATTILAIDAAQRDATKAKLTEQMLRELERGGVYMGMKHAPSARKGKKARRAPRRAR